MEITNIRLELAKKSKWNIGYFIAGFVFWVYVSITSIIIPFDLAKIYWIVGTFLIFPVAVFASKLCKADPFSSNNPLGNLVGYTHMSVISMSYPIVLIVFFKYPEILLLTMAILYCLDFYVMTWAFGTPIFGVSAAFRVLISTIIWLAFPKLSAIAIPVFISLSYLVIVLVVPAKRLAWINLNENKA